MMSGCSSKFFIAFANSVELSGSTRIPFLLSCTVKGIPCEFVEMTGFLNANDSKGTKGDNSQTEGRTRN